MNIPRAKHATIRKRLRWGWTVDFGTGTIWVDFRSWDEAFQFADEALRSSARRSDDGNRACIPGDMSLWMEAAQ